jgi:uncharacterized membrane protein YphA (DoxX/SURF4 family)
MTAGVVYAIEETRPVTGSVAKERPALHVPALRGWGWGLMSRMAILFGLPSFANILELHRVGINLSRYRDFAFPLFQRYIMPAKTGTFPGDLDVTARYTMLYELSFALLGAVVWLLLDRRRKHEAVIHEAGRLVARYVLAGMLFYYGGEKFVGDQGGWSLEPEHQMDLWGNNTGFEAMMAWLSYSTLYAWFAGWAEAGAGVLMFFRRFTTLAALLTLADMGMVWLINQSYWDSWGGAAFSPIHFMPYAVFLLLPQATRLADFFVRNTPTVTVFDRITPPQWFRVGSVALKCVVVPLIIYKEVIGSVYHGQAVHTYSPLHGVYEVVEFQRNGVVEPIASDFPRRWLQVAITGLNGTDNSRGDIYGRTIHDKNFSYDVYWPDLKLEMEGPTLIERARNARLRVSRTKAPEGDLRLQSSMMTRIKSSKKGTFGKVDTLGLLHYTRAGFDNVILEGTVEDEKLKVRLRRIPLESQPYFRIRWKPI